MTDTTREAVERLLDGVTPSKAPNVWRVQKRYSFICHRDTWQVLWDVPNSTSVCLVADTGGDTYSDERDALFIAAARELVPALLARAEAAEAELLAMRQAVQHANDHADAAIKDLKALEQKLEQETRRRQSMTDTAFDWKARADLATPAAMPPEMRKAVHELEQLANRLSCGTAASRGTADSIMEIIAALRAGGQQ